MNDTKKRRVSHRGSKQKGSNYEREVAAYINEVTGLNVRRALLSGGGRHDGAADLEGLPGYSAELKRTEKLNIHEAMAQSIEAAEKTGDVIPIVITRRNSQSTGGSLVVMRLSDFALLIKKEMRQ